MIHTVPKKIREEYEQLELIRNHLKCDEGFVLKHWRDDLNLQDATVHMNWLIDLYARTIFEGLRDINNNTESPRKKRWWNRRRQIDELPQ